MANVTIQVIEHHIVRDLEKIFWPVKVSCLSEEDAKRMASEPTDMGKERSKLEDKIKKLIEGQNAFKSAMSFSGR